MNAQLQSAQPVSDAAYPPSARLRILWADDDEIVRRLGRAILTGAGHEVTLVKDGREAVEELAAGPDRWDVLITDHDMPRIDGLMLVRQLPHLRFAGRVIVVSGSIDEPLAISYRQCGVEAILAKPFDPQALIAVVASGSDS